MRSRMPLVAVALAALAIPSTVQAHGGPPVVVTEVVADTAVVPFFGCSGELEGFVTIDFRDTFHITEFADGHVSVTGNNRGWFDYEPFVGVPSTGRYKSGFHVTGTDNVFVLQDVFVGVGVDEEGVRNNFNIREHVTFANGEVRVEYFVGCD